jgi:hypothetical protein
MLPLWEARTLLGTLLIMNMQSSRTSMTRRHRRRKEEKQRLRFEKRRQRKSPRNLKLNFKPTSNDKNEGTTVTGV